MLRGWGERDGGGAVEGGHALAAALLTGELGDDGTGE